MYIIFAIVIAINIFWVINTPVLPFIDLPFRLAESRIIKEYENTDFLYQKYYSIPSYLKSNTLHTYFCSSGIFGDVETANKIYYILYIFLLPVSVLILIRKLKGNIYYSLLSVLFLINHNVHWGFTGYTMSVPVLFLVFGFYYEYLINNNNKYLLVIFIFWLMLFFLHFQSVLFAFLVFFVLSLAFRPGKLITGMMLSFPVMLLMYHSYSIDSGSYSTLTYLFDYYSHYYIFSVFERIQIFFILDNFFLFENLNGIIYALFFSMIISVLFIYSVFKQNKKYIKTEFRYSFVIIIVSAACYLLLPDKINGQNVIYERYSVIVFLLMIVIISTEFGYRREKLMQILITACCLIHSAVINDYMLDFKLNVSGFNSDIMPAKSGKTLAGIIFDNEFRGRKVFSHFPMYYTVWNNGITTGIIDYRFGLIKRNISKDEFPVYIEWYESPIDYSDYYKNINYLLVSSKSIRELKNFRLIKNSGEWYLFENNFP